ncbi:MAG: hypothetical protein U0360_09730 [Dehalococcoidia bacterium]
MRNHRTTAGVAVTTVLVVLASGLVLTSSRNVASAGGMPSTLPSLSIDAGASVPVLAYYETAYTAQTWAQDRLDAPALGLYPSTNREVIGQHVKMARAAGVTGFIVHWRSTERRNQVLDALVEEARAQGFKLAIEYEALDIRQKPLPIGTVAADLDSFAERWAGDPVFRVFGQPLVIIEGSSEFSMQDLSVLSARHRAAHERDLKDPGQFRELLLLASERDAEGYRRVQNVVDGNAPYWASADPGKKAEHAQRLAAMRDAVGDGILIAPVAPGFDASLLGGTRTTERLDGRTLEDSLHAAAAASPQALGLISWNGYHDNTEIEPSVRFGTRSLEVLASFTGGRAPESVTPPSGVEAPSVSTPGGSRDLGPVIRPLLGLATMFVVLLTVVGALIYGYAVRRPVTRLY